MIAYLAGVATPFVVGAIAWLILAYADNVRGTRIYLRDPHPACGLRHAHRPWLPWQVMKVTAIPLARWRCARGAQVPVWLSGGGGRSRTVRSNTPDPWAAQ